MLRGEGGPFPGLCGLGAEEHSPLSKCIWQLFRLAMSMSKQKQWDSIHLSASDSFMGPPHGAGGAIGSCFQTDGAGGLEIHDFEVCSIVVPDFCEAVE